MTRNPSDPRRSGSSAKRFDNINAAGYLAYDGDNPCGLAAVFLRDDDPTTANLVSMWVAATHRRCGVGQLLVHTILKFVRSRQARQLQLMVTSNNAPAVQFYEKIGFQKTGRSEAYPNDSRLREWEMGIMLGEKDPRG